jgi:hypothetical protein
MLRLPVLALDGGERTGSFLEILGGRPGQRDVMSSVGAGRHVEHRGLLNAVFEGEGGTGNDAAAVSGHLARLFVGLFDQGAAAGEIVGELAVECGQRLGEQGDGPKVVGVCGDGWPVAGHQLEIALAFGDDLLELVGVGSDVLVSGQRVIVVIFGLGDGRRSAAAAVRRVVKERIAKRHADSAIGLSAVGVALVERKPELAPILTLLLADLGGLLEQFDGLADNGFGLRRHRPEFADDLIDPAGLPHWPVLTKSKILNVLFCPFSKRTPRSSYFSDRPC